MPRAREASFHEYYNQGPWTAVDGAAEPWVLGDWSNMYIGVRYAGALGLELGVWKLKYAEFDPYGSQSGFATPYMYALFNLTADPFELRNVYNATAESAPELVAALHNLMITRAYLATTSAPARVARTAPVTASNLRC